MGVDVTDSESCQGVLLDEMQHFLMGGNVRLGEILEGIQD